MSLDLAIWLFGTCGVGICGAFGFAWHCNGARVAAIETLKDEIYNYKVHVAEHFASVTYAGAIERRTVDALTEIKSSLLRQNEKLDRLMERGQ